MAVQSKGTSLRTVVSVILHHRKFGQQSGHSSSFLSAPQTGLVLSEEVSIDPEVIAAIEGLVYSVREWSTARA